MLLEQRFRSRAGLRSSWSEKDKTVRVEHDEARFACFLYAKKRSIKFIGLLYMKMLFWAPPVEKYLMRRCPRFFPHCAAPDSVGFGAAEGMGREGAGAGAGAGVVAVSGSDYAAGG